MVGTLILREIVMPSLFSVSINNFWLKLERMVDLVFMFGCLNVVDCLLDS